jgi:hypothetical protein
MTMSTHTRRPPDSPGKFTNQTLASPTNITAHQWLPVPHTSGAATATRTFDRLGRMHEAQCRSSCSKKANRHGSQAVTARPIDSHTLSLNQSGPLTQPCSAVLAQSSICTQAPTDISLVVFSLSCQFGIVVSETCARPCRQILKMGASASLLMANNDPSPSYPSYVLYGSEMPTAMYKSGATTCLSAQPAQCNAPSHAKYEEYPPRCRRNIIAHLVLLTSVK